MCPQSLVMTAHFAPFCPFLGCLFSSFTLVMGFLTTRAQQTPPRDEAREAHPSCGAPCTPEVTPPIQGQDTEAAALPLPGNPCRAAERSMPPAARRQDMRPWRLPSGASLRGWHRLHLQGEPAPDIMAKAVWELPRPGGWDRSSSLHEINSSHAGRLPLLLTEGFVLCRGRPGQEQHGDLVTRLCLHGHSARQGPCGHQPPSSLHLSHSRTDIKPPAPSALMRESTSGDARGRRCSGTLGQGEGLLQLTHSKVRNKEGC